MINAFYSSIRSVDLLIIKTENMIQNINKPVVKTIEIPPCNEATLPSLL